MKMESWPMTLIARTTDTRESVAHTESPLSEGASDVSHPPRRSAVPAARLRRLHWRRLPHIADSSAARTSALHAPMVDAGRGRTWPTVPVPGLTARCLSALPRRGHPHRVPARDLPELGRRRAASG